MLLFNNIMYYLFILKIIFIFFNKKLYSNAKFNSSLYISNSNPVSIIFLVLINFLLKIVSNINLHFASPILVEHSGHSDFPEYTL